MGHLDQIKSWMQERSEMFHLRTMFLSNFSEWLPGYYDCKIGFSLEDRNYLGRGTSRDEQGALGEAIQDATQKLLFERLKRPQGLTVAAGLSFDEAVLAARLRVIEQDAFLCHYFTKTPFYPTSLSGFEKIPSFLTDSTIKLSSHGIRFEIREMRRTHDAYSLVALAIGVRAPKPFGAVVGIASDVSYFNAMERAVLRCVRNVLPLIEGKTPDSDLAPEALDPAFVPVVSEYLRLPSEAELRQWADHLTELSDIAVTPIHKIDFVPEFAVAPLEFAQASSEGFQSFFAGPLVAEKLCFERLNHFLGRSVELNELQQYPCPLIR